MDDLDAETLDAAGFEAMGEGSFDDAINYFSQAIEKNPTNGVYYTDRCAGYLGKLNVEKAIEDGKKGVELCPDNARCNMQLGVIYDFQKEWSKGLECYEKGLKLEPNNETILALVRHDKTRLSNRGENILTGVELLEFLDSKGEEVAYLTRSPELYYFIDDISEDYQNAINYVGDPIMDLFIEYMKSDIIPEKDKQKWEEAMKEIERKVEEEKKKEEAEAEEDDDEENN